MNIDNFKNWLIQREYKKIARNLAQADATKDKTESEKKACEVVKYALKNSAAYRQLMQENGIKESDIKTIEDFRQHIPVIDKTTWFKNNSIQDLLQNKTINDLDMFWSSSGHSGTYSFGAGNKKDFKNLGIELEFLLGSRFGTIDDKTLLVNGLSIGTQIPVNQAAVLNVGTRDDVAAAIIDKFQSRFSKFIVAGEPTFVKSLTEELERKEFSFDKKEFHIVTGGYYFPETFRTYLESIINRRPASSKNRVFTSMGLSELSLSIFGESEKTAEIRRFANKNNQFLKELAGSDIKICPPVMQFFPQKTYIEVVKKQEGKSSLVITMLDTGRAIPMIRYDTGDSGIIVQFSQLEKLLLKWGKADLIPEFRLPIALVYGRPEEIALEEGKILKVQHVLEALYLDHLFAASVNGNFQISKEEDSYKIFIQLKKGIVPSEDLAMRFDSAFFKFAQFKLQCKLVQYEQCTFNMAPDLERKFRFTD
jgi:phenylacetate-CoA ligase